jgi:hypothetical protein
MKKTLIAASFFAMAATTAMPAHAASNWCANYGRDGRENCHFSSFRQCQAFIQGLGGSCRPSQYRSSHRRRGRETYGMGPDR